MVTLAVRNSSFHQLVACIHVLVDNRDSSSAWVLLFFSSFSYDRPVDLDDLFVSAAYMHIGSPHLAKYGENKK